MARSPSPTFAPPLSQSPASVRVSRPSLKVIPSRRLNTTRLPPSSIDQREARAGWTKLRASRAVSPSKTCVSIAAEPASPICADGHLFLFSLEGKGYVVNADREGKLVATNTLAAGVRGTPAIAGKALYVRTLTHLYRIEKK